MTENYHTILTELALLTTVSVLLFGFLLTRTEGRLSDIEEWLLAIALITVASATMVFILPVAYHRLQFPYADWEKFQLRSHSFIRLGFPLLAAGLYLSLTLAVWDLFEAGSFFVAGLPLVLTTLILAARRLIP